MLKSETIQVTLDSQSIKWYRYKGYDIPIHKRQCFANKNGKRIKNGHKIGVKDGTKLLVKVNDLKPKSNVIICFICDTCKQEFTTTWQAHKSKISNNCRSCQAKNGFKGGCHDYWVSKLIVNNTKAQCDISGEKDKRFLVLHHLLNRKNGGKNEESNYVILSANYHLAFHTWNGGMNINCTADQYYEFKEQEKIKQIN